MIAWQDRTPKLMRPSEYFPGTMDRAETQFDGWYSFLINEWIPNQPDSEELMALFIDCKFEPYPFICILRWPDIWQEKIKQWIEKKDHREREGKD